MTDDTVRDAGYDEWLDAIADGDGYYLECPNDHGWLPPRRVCPTCGERTLERRSLAPEGTVVTYTVVHVPTPEFEGSEPYVTAIAEFDAVRVTGILLEVDPDAVSLGDRVVPAVVDDDERRRLAFELV